MSIIIHNPYSSPVAMPYPFSGVLRSGARVPVSMTAQAFVDVVGGIEALGGLTITDIETEPSTQAGFEQHTEFGETLNQAQSLAGTVNITSASIDEGFWQRTGSVVTTAVRGTCEVSATGFTIVGLDLPYPSTFTQGGDGSGAGWVSDPGFVTLLPSPITQYSGARPVSWWGAAFTAVASGTHTFGLNFTYRVK